MAMTLWQWKNKATGEVVSVVAIVGGVALVRFKGCSVFVVQLREFTEKWEPLPWR